MKCLIALIFNILLCNLNAQLAANAGPDLYLCSNQLAPINQNRGSLLLGGNPSASAGTPPYNYIWTTSVQKASDFLDDTSIANPTIIKFPITNRDVHFYLTVKDASGQTAKDSFLFYNSKCKVIAANALVYKHEKDTVVIGTPGTSGGKLPYSCVHSPDIYLIYAPSCGTKTYTPSDREYQFRYTDSLGCPCSHAVDVVIKKSKVFNPKTEPVFMKVENPIDNNSIYVKNPDWQQKLRIKVFNLAGELVLSEIIEDSIEIGKMLPEKGIYFTIIYSDDKEVFNFKLFRK
jgi:hypothetical protein